MGFSMEGFSFTWSHPSSVVRRKGGGRFLLGLFYLSQAMGFSMEGFSFTWSHPSVTKMSKLDTFLVSDGIILLFPSITALYLDRHLSDHRPILLREILLDFGPTPFRFYHSWFSYDGFDEMVKKTWRSFSYSDTNRMIRFKKKLQELKSSIRLWVKDKWANLSSLKYDIVSELCEIDKELDSGLVLDDQLARRLDLKGQLYDINDKEVSDRFQKSKVRWAIEGDDNSSFFHGIINKKRSQLAIRGILVDASWQSDPQVVKEVFRNHFAARFKKQNSSGPKINYSFPNRLSQEQVLDLEREVLHDEIRLAVWSCGDNKKNKRAMFFKVDFAKGYDSVRWDYLIDVLEAVGFGLTWCQWIRGLQINFHKSQLLGVGAARPEIKFAASSIGCTIMENQFRYLGVTVGGNMSRCKAWSDIVSKLRSLLSKWKTKTLSIGGRLTLLKSVLGASPLYCMSIFKAPKALRDSFPRMFALEMEKNYMVATKMVVPVDASFRRSVREGIELFQFNEL
nr:RNA-directed DNA polymerase, eukaryota [Tanacetum cinerariifolium]